jgi:pimeloyl-ACP methyl ester carboxylesterase
MSPKNENRLKLSAHLLGAWFLLATPLTSQTPQTPLTPAANRLTFEPTTFKPASGEPVAAELGTLVVPQSRNASSERTIKLKLVRFRSTSQNPGPPIVYLAGGPGGSGIDAAKGARFPLFMALRELGDVIALDQRGTGQAEPSLRCSEWFMLPPAKPLDRAEAEGIFAAGMKTCFERLSREGIDATAYTTLESAHDVDDLRQALGADKITLWGISYGTHLALATLREHGDHVDRAILAGVEPLGHTLKLPSDQEALLRSVSALVKSDRAVAASVPDLTAAIARVLARLQKEPVTVTLVHPMAGQSIAVQVGPLDLQYVLAGMLEGPDTFAGMPDFVSRLEGGDWTALALQASRFSAGILPSAMSVAMDCASGASAGHLGRIRSEAKKTLLGDAINLPFPGICQGLGVPDLGDAYRKPFRSKTPLLLISGTLDGRTPPRNAEGLMKGFTRAQHLVIEGAGHSDPLFLSSPQILEAMRSFLRGKKIPVKRIVLDPVRFLPTRAVVELPGEVLSRYVGTYRIEGDDVRHVFKAGSILYTQRGKNLPNPLRPTSATDFFWEGLPGAVRFEVAADGKATALWVDPDGTGRTLQKASKID